MKKGIVLSFQTQVDHIVLDRSKVESVKRIPDPDPDLSSPLLGRTFEWRFVSTVDHFRRKNRMPIWWAGSCRLNNNNNNTEKLKFDLASSTYNCFNSSFKMVSLIYFYLVLNLGSGLCPVLENYFPNSGQFIGFRYNL